MFSGIVQGLATVVSVEEVEGRCRLTLELPPVRDAAPVTGASVSVAGVCLTVTAGEGAAAAFDVVGETLRLTNLGELEPGDAVNVERSVRVGDEIGGHTVSGHVDGAAEVVAVEREAGNCTIHFRPPAELLPFILRKGFVALDGCSLTVAAVDRDRGSFSVALIPETLRATTHGHLAAGSRVNLEVDRQTQAVVETVRRVLAEEGWRPPG